MNGIVDPSMESTAISFVIPALNEAHNIGSTLRSIQSAAAEAKLTPIQIIVVDHGSSDSTVSVATQHGATVIVHRGGTVGELRNVGAREAKGATLIFIDADVTLTKEWATHISTYLTRIEGGEHLITGSHCAPPDSQNPFLKYWFSSLALDPRNTHVGTGHMIIGREDFAMLGGFNHLLRTGEDYEFCERAIANGFSIKNAPELKVTHHDFPESISAFIKREAWHGAGDLTSLKSARQSKVVVASALFLLIHIALLVGIVNSHLLLTALSFTLLVALLAFSSFIKNKHMSFSTIAWNSLIFYAYYTGRALAIFQKCLPGSRT